MHGTQSLGLFHFFQSSVCRCHIDIPFGTYRHGRGELDGGVTSYKTVPDGNVLCDQIQCQSFRVDPDDFLTRSVKDEKISLVAQVFSLVLCGRRQNATGLPVDEWVFPIIHANARP